MDNEHREDDNQGASTSKKENKDRKDDDGYDDRDREHDRDDRSYSQSYSASEYSAKSRVELRKEPRVDPSKLPVGKREAKPDRKKRVRRGRIGKRRRSPRRYNPMRRVVKRRPRMLKRDRQREASVSTILSRVSSRSASDVRSCTYCGHRCCGRRCCCSERRLMRRIFVKKITKELRKLRQMEAMATKSGTYRPQRGKAVPKGPRGALLKVGHTSECVQAGSHSKLLSPLLIETNATLDDADGPQRNRFVEVTPDMIYEAVRNLTMWRQAVPYENIMDFVRSHYPVTSNTEDLERELLNKLNVATVAGIVTETCREGIVYWSLTCELQGRGLSKNHVSLFWKIYGDTMSPVQKRVGPQPNQNLTSETGNRGSGIFGPNTII